ncbi:hypothetical protein REPUB_Repub13aG0073300 [Reevesia pubescens]
MTHEKQIKIEAKDCSRISHLPDDILTSILSLLSLKEAFRTRILSRRWRHLSPHITNLCFDSLTIFGKTFDYKFMSRRKEFVTKVAQCLRHLRIPKLNSFQVSFSLWKDTASYIDECISIATTMAVEKIDLHFFNVLEGVEPYNFPCHLLPACDQASHLEHLCLNFCILRLGPDSTNRLSSLKTLFLDYVPLNQSDLESIVSGCLKLECLTLRNCQLPEMFRIHGQLHHLKSLVIVDCLYDSSTTIEIHNSINLNQFEYEGRSEKISLKDLPCLERVHLGHPRTDLAIDIHPKAVPRLQNLSLSFYFYRKFCRCAAKFERGRRQPRTYTDKHVHSQLKEVEINGFCNKDSEVELAVYLLHAATALERMTINLQSRVYISSGRWVYGRIPSARIAQKDVHDTLIKEIVDSNLGVELIVL